MAYSVKETVNNLVEFESARGDKVIVSQHIKDETNEVTYDIRKWYTPEDGKLTPTKQGVRLNVENTVEAISAIMATLSNEDRQKVNEAVNKIVAESEFGSVGSIDELGDD